MNIFTHTQTHTYMHSFFLFLSPSKSTHTKVYIASHISQTLLASAAKYKDKDTKRQTKVGEELPAL